MLFNVTALLPLNKCTKLPILVPVILKNVCTCEMHLHCYVSDIFIRYSQLKGSLACPHLYLNFKKTDFLSNRLHLIRILL